MMITCGCLDVCHGCWELGGCLGGLGGPNEGIGVDPVQACLIENCSAGWNTQKEALDTHVISHVLRMTA